MQYVCIKGFELTNFTLPNSNIISTADRRQGGRRGEGGGRRGEGWELELYKKRERGKEWERPK